MLSLSYFCVTQCVVLVHIIIWWRIYNIQYTIYNIQYSNRFRKTFRKSKKNYYTYEATFSPKSFRCFRHHKVENQAMYTRTANAEKIYLKTQINKEIFIRNYEESYLNQLNSLNCTKYRISPHEELSAHKRGAPQRRTQIFFGAVGGH